MNTNKNTITDSFIDISVNIGNLQINFILQTGFFDIESEWVVSSHFHSCYEFHFIQEGSIELDVGDNTIFLKKDDICIIPPDLNHYTKKVFQSTKKASLLFNFSSQKICDYSKRDEYKFYNNIYSKINKVSVINNSDIYDKYLKNIIDIFETNQISSIHKTRALFTLVFIEITENITNDNSVVSEYKVSTSSLKTYEEANQSKNIRIVKIENYINENYMNDITLYDLANHLHLSKKQTDRTLKKLTGLSFGKLLLKRRMARAKELIINSQIPINEIASEIGYNSYNGFYSAFKNVFSVSPLSLRNFR